MFMMSAKMITVKLFCYTLFSVLITFYGVRAGESETDLKLVFIIFRHGERVPETNEQYPTDTYKIEYFYPLTYGDVTKEGKRRQYALGKKLRKRYNDFLGPFYTTKKVATYSTDWDRTKMSALLLLAGLFPPHPSEIWDDELKWLPIPYNYKTSEHDHLIQRPDPYCPKYMEELHRVYESEEVRNITRKYKKDFEYVSKHSGRDVFDFHEMLRVFQNIHAKRFLNLTIPDWAESIYPEPMQTIASYQCAFENYNPFLRRLNGGHMVKKLIELAKQKIDGTLEPSERQMFLYSAHENNIVNILAVLGLYEQHIPPYCSAVLIELHHNKIGDEYGFKIYYENDTYSDSSQELIITGCDEFCPFGKLLNLTKDVLPGNYTEECGSSVFLD